MMHKETVTITKPTPKKIMKTPPRNILVAATAAVVVLIAGYLVTSSHAATYFAATEAEGSTLTGNAQKVSDTGASGGQAVQFNAPAAPPPGGGGGGGTTPPTGSTTCPLPKYPTPACTGVPSGTVLSAYTGPETITTAGTVIDGKHVTGDLIIKADTTIKNSQVDGTIHKEDSGGVTLVVQDTTVGPASGCVIGPALDTGNDTGNYTATRLYVRNHDDAYRAGGPNITIQDSYAKMCGVGASQSPPDGSHSDGVQDYPATYNLTINHSTFDECGNWTTPPTSQATCVQIGQNGPIFIASNPTRGSQYGSTNVTISNNLVLGGANGIWTYPWLTYNLTGGHNPGVWKIFGNRVVNNTQAYAAYESEGQCGNVAQWSDNTTVTIDANYNITSTVATKACGQD
ncbi:MAG TPA: hypothetical protein VLI54_00700 [Bacillota bacterium]|nr:hypothetical protein [Bacillota bacterium]